MLYHCAFIILYAKIFTMKNFILFFSLFVVCSLSAFAGGTFPPNGKKCEVEGMVIYVDKSCTMNVSWREMLWEFENNPEIFIGSVSENCVDSVVWKHVYGEGWDIKTYEKIDKSPVVGFTLNQCKNFAVFRATAVMELFKYGMFKQYKDTKLEYFMLSSEQYAELLKQKWFAKSFVDGYAEITSDGKFVKDGKILDSVDDGKVTFRMYAVITE